MKTISILGTGCPKCKKLYQNVEEAVSGNADYKIEKITDIMKIMKFDVIVTPALAVDGKVVASGKVLSIYLYIKIKTRSDLLLMVTTELKPSTNL